MDLHVLKEANSDLEISLNDNASSKGKIKLPDAIKDGIYNNSADVKLITNETNCIIVIKDLDIDTEIDKVTISKVQEIINRLRAVRKLNLILVDKYQEDVVVNKKTKNQVIKRVTSILKVKQTEEIINKILVTVEDHIEDIERRFIEVSGLEIKDMSVYPMLETVKEETQVTTDKEMSDEFSEVFTPLWLVDKMIEQSELDWKDQTKTTLDLCSGYGQFTIRLLRKKYAELGEDFDVFTFLNDTHWFNELQLSSCFKLLYIFGANINICIGDSMMLTVLDEDDSGIVYYYAESKTKGAWINIDSFIIKLLSRYDSLDECDAFTTRLEKELDMKKTLSLYTRKIKYAAISKVTQD